MPTPIPLCAASTLPDFDRCSGSRDHFTGCLDHRADDMLGRPALAASLAVRLLVAVTIRTAFAPDEYWQSLEVAHRLAFGWAVAS